MHAFLHPRYLLLHSVPGGSSCIAMEGDRYSCNVGGAHTYRPSAARRDETHVIKLCRKKRHLSCYTNPFSRPFLFDQQN